MMKDNGFEDAIRKEIEVRKRNFSTDESAFRSHVRHIADTVQDYNGRQIFEMLQNMDDQMADAPSDARKSQIVFDRTRKSVSFFNQGEPFSVAGIKSIMMPNISPKTDRKTIGNKGLGFRSLLNWKPMGIVIRSNGLALEFSNNAIREVMETCDGLKSNIQRLPLGVEVPILMFPRILPYTQEQSGIWATEIELNGLSEKALDDIERELLSFRSELMLFLPNLRELVIQIVGGISILYSASEWKLARGGGAHIFQRSIGKAREGEASDRMDWIAFRQEGTLDTVQKKTNEPSAYNLAIAILCDASRRNEIGYALHNYLPVRSTEQAVEIRLPCLVHATVALNSARDGLLPGNEANRQIFSKILPAAFKEFALFLRENADGDSPLLKDRWFPWRLLSPRERIWSGNQYINSLYEQLHEFAQKEAFIPCVDGHFRTLNDCRACPNTENGRSVTAFFNRHTKILPSYVLSSDCSCIPENFQRCPFHPGELKLQIENFLLENKIDDDDLAELIRVLWLIGQLNMESSGPYDVLRNDAGQYFSPSDIVYMPTGMTRVAVPPYMTLGFVSNSLWASIASVFKNDIANKGIKQREFISKELKGKILRISYPDKFEITRQIVSECKQRLASEPNTQRKQELISQQLLALFQNYDPDGTDGQEGDLVKHNIPLCITSDGTVRHAGEFLFEKAKAVYKDQLPAELFLSDGEKRQLLGDSGVSPRGERFLRALGVRDDVRVLYAHLDPTKDDTYLSFLIECGINRGGLPPPSQSSEPLDNHPNLARLRDHEIIRNLPLEDLLRLFCMTSRDGLVDFLLARPSISWTEIRKWYPRKFAVQWSYCAFQLRDSRKGLVIEECSELRDKYERPLLDAGRLPETIDTLLCHMGARRKFADLSLEELYARLSAFDARVGIQGFYQRIRAAIKIHLDACPNEKERKQLVEKCQQLSTRFLPTLFARKGKGPIERVERRLIRYWDNDTLPRSLLEQFYKLEIGSRVGTQSVRQIFGVAPLGEAEMQIAILTEDIATEMTHDLEEHLHMRQIYILALRSRDLPNSREQAKAASALRNLCGHIKVVHACVYEFNGTSYQMKDGDLLQTDEGFRICTAQKSLTQALSRPEFCQALCEMLCIQFKLTGPRIAGELRNAIKCTPEEIEVYRANDLTDEDWRRAAESLGLGSEEKALWRTKLGRNLSAEEEGQLAFRGSREKVLRELIGEPLPMSVPADIPLGAMTPSQTDAFIRWLGSPESTLGETTKNKLGVHLREQFEELHKSYSFYFANTLHQRLSTAMPEEQKRYFDILGQYQAPVWYERALATLVQIHPLATENDLWNVFRQVFSETFGIIPTKETTKIHHKPPEAGKSYLQILEELDVDLDSLDAQERSLAFFPGNEAEFRTAILRRRLPNEYVGVPSEERGGEVSLLPEATIRVVSDIQQFQGAIIPGSGTPSNKSRRLGAATHYQSDRRRRQLGRQAQNIVKDTMSKSPEIYRNFRDWSSLTDTTGLADDSVHYDFSYETPAGERRYVEVKAFDSGRFFMSAGEYRFACSEKYCKQYELALVTGNVIQLIQAPFAPDSPWHSKFHIEIENYRGYVSQ